MRLNWIIAAGNSVSMYDIHNACMSFFSTHRVVPDTVKMTYNDMNNLFSQFPTKMQVLERNKDYGQFLAIPGGMVELLLLEEQDESVVNMNGGSMMVIESTQIDREFEKHVLNKEDK